MTLHNIEQITKDALDQGVPLSKLVEILNVVTKAVYGSQNDVPQKLRQFLAAR